MKLPWTTKREQAPAKVLETYEQELDHEDVERGKRRSATTVYKATQYYTRMVEQLQRLLNDYPDPTLWRTHEWGGTIKALAQGFAAGEVPTYHALVEWKQPFLEVGEHDYQQLLSVSALYCNGRGTHSSTEINIDDLPKWWSIKHVSPEAVQIIEGIRDHGVVRIPQALLEKDENALRAQSYAARLLDSINGGALEHGPRTDDLVSFRQISIDNLGSGSKNWVAWTIAQAGQSSIRILSQQPLATLMPAVGFRVGEAIEGVLLKQGVTRLESFGYSYTAAERNVDAVTKRIKEVTGLSTANTAPNAYGQGLSVEVFAPRTLSSQEAIDKLKAAIDILANHLGTPGESLS